MDSTKSRLFEAIHPILIPARLITLDIELVETVFSYPKESPDLGGSVPVVSWNKGQ